MVSKSAPMPKKPEPASARGGSAEGKAKLSEAAASVQVNRQLIYNADLEIKVDEFTDAEQAIKQKAETFGGYVAETSSQRNWEGKLNGSLNVRVPSKRFREALQAFAALGEVTRQREWTEDVTEEYLDVKARIASKRALEQRLLILLAERTAKLSDLVAVEEKLAQVRSEIEQAEGRMRYLKNRIEFSTITVALYEPSSERADEESVLQPLRWASEQVGKLFFGSIGVVLLITVGLAPWLVLAYVIVKIVITVRRKRRASKQVEDKQ